MSAHPRETHHKSPLIPRAPYLPTPLRRAFGTKSSSGNPKPDSDEAAAFGNTPSARPPEACRSLANLLGLICFPDALGVA